MFQTTNQSVFVALSDSIRYEATRLLVYRNGEHPTKLKIQQRTRVLVDGLCARAKTYCNSTQCPPQATGNETPFLASFKGLGWGGMFTSLYTYKCIYIYIYIYIVVYIYYI